MPHVAERAAGVGARIERAFQQHLISIGPTTDAAADAIATPQ
jgi:hypothetical protein